MKTMLSLLVLVTVSMGVVPRKCSGGSSDPKPFALCPTSSDTGGGNPAV